MLLLPLLMNCCREPPLLSCAMALAASPSLLPVLGDAPTTTSASPTHVTNIVLAPPPPATTNSAAAAAAAAGGKGRPAALGAAAPTKLAEMTLPPELQKRAWGSQVGLPAFRSDGFRCLPPAVAVPLTRVAAAWRGW